MPADGLHRSEEPLYTARYDPDRDHSPSILIIDSLAAVADADGRVTVSDKIISPDQRPKR